MPSTLFCLEKNPSTSLPSGPSLRAEGRVFEKNYAFIDSQNVNLGVQELNWRLDWRRFRIYLKEKYGVAKAYMFIGYLSKNKHLYRALQEYGYILIFKPILMDQSGKVKGNVDADLVLKAMIEFNNYDRAIIATSDGDFYCLVDYLYRQNKLKKVVSPCRRYCSILLQKNAKEQIVYLDNLRKKLEYK